MKKVKVGFFKRPQGVFTKEVIQSIIDKLKANNQIELFPELDFRQFYIKNGKVFCGDFDLSELDVYFWHDTVSPTDWLGDNFFLNVLKVLENDCIVINSSEATKITNDKFLAHTILAQNNLPVAEFALVNPENKISVSNAFKSLGNPVLIKPRFGGWGIGIEKIASENDFFAFMDKSYPSSELKHRQVLLEKYYPNDLSKWIAVVVIGEKVVFGYQKKNLGHSDWKIFDPDKIDGKGEYSEYVSPPEDLKKIALKAKKVIGKDIIGFDFIFTEEGYKIVDENGRPGLYKKCLEGAGIDIEEEIINLIFSKIKLIG